MSETKIPAGQYEVKIRARRKVKGTEIFIHTGNKNGEKVPGYIKMFF
jgi:hypothetical protein